MKLSAVEEHWFVRQVAEAWCQVKLCLVLHHQGVQSVHDSDNFSLWLDWYLQLIDYRFGDKKPAPTAQEDKGKRSRAEDRHAYPVHSG